MTQNLSVGFWIKIENTLHIISQVVCTLFQRSGAKLLAYGDSLRTGVEKGLLHNSNAISHFCFIYQYINRFCFILIMYLLSFIFVQKPTGRSTIYARFFATFSSASTFWNSCISVAISLLNRSRQIRFGIAISAFAISEKFHARSSEVVAPMYTTRENMIR